MTEEKDGRYSCFIRRLYPANTRPWPNVGSMLADVVSCLLGSERKNFHLWKKVCSFIQCCVCSFKHCQDWFLIWEHPSRNMESLSKTSAARFRLRVECTWGSSQPHGTLVLQVLSSDMAQGDATLTFDKKPFSRHVARRSQSQIDVH